MTIRSLLLKPDTDRQLTDRLGRRNSPLRSACLETDNGEDVAVNWDEVGGGVLRGEHRSKQQGPQ